MMLSIIRQSCPQSFPPMSLANPPTAIPIQQVFLVETNDSFLIYCPVRPIEDLYSTSERNERRRKSKILFGKVGTTRGD
jgi:hypothetical protein